MEQTIRTLTTLTEMAELLPPLSEEQLETLEQDILANGCYSPIIVNEENIIVDGHNRYGICKKHSLPYDVRVMKFQDLLEAKQWAFETQKARRNLTKWEIGQIVMKLKPELEIKAKEKEFERKTTFAKNEKSFLPIVNTTEELASAADISTSTMNKIIQITEKAPEFLQAAVANCEISISKAYDVMKQMKTISDEDKEEYAKIMLDYEIGIKKAESDGKMARHFIDALYYSDLIEVNIENVRIWLNFAGIQPEFVDGYAKEIEANIIKYTEFARILREVIIPNDIRRRESV